MDLKNVKAVSKIEKRNKTRHSPKNMAKMFDYAFYHQNCPDGFGGQWVIYHYCEINCFKHPKYVPLAAGMNPCISNLARKRIVFVDVCPHPSFLKDYLSLGSKITILDHHKTSMELLQGIAHKNLEVFFDMDKCGAEIAWNYFFPHEKSPFFIDYLKDKDLWLLQMPFTHEINFALGEHLTLEAFSAFFREEESSYKMLLAEGKPLKEKHDQEIEKISKRALPAFFSHAGKRYTISIVENSQRHLTSDVGNHLCEIFSNIDFAVITFTGHSYCSVSLRGKKGKCPDLCAIAKTFGGGGHVSSAGLRVPNLKTFANIEFISNECKHIEKVKKP